MAFKKELLTNCKYDCKKSLSEEKTFLNNFTIPIIQLDPLTILVVSHSHNTYSKKKLLHESNNKMYNTSYTIDDFIKNKDIKIFLQVI